MIGANFHHALEHAHQLQTAVVYGEVELGAVHNHLRVTGAQRIFAADDSLQRGHLSDHLSRQIRFGQMHSAAGKDRFVFFESEHRN